MAQTQLSELREQIKRDIQAFKRAGGKITKVPYGVLANPPGNFNKQKDLTR